MAEPSVARATYAAAPSTERGVPTLLGGCAKSGRLAYTNGRSVVMRSLASPTDAAVYGEHAVPATVARFSPNGEWVASGDAAGNVHVWGAGGEPGQFPLKNDTKALAGAIMDLDWSPDGQRIVVGGEGGKGALAKCFMWDSGNALGTFDGLSKRINSVSFRPNRPFRIVTGSEDMSVAIFKGPPFAYLDKNSSAHSNFVNCVRYAPDGSRVLSVGSDKKGVLFDGESLAQISVLPEDGGHTSAISACAWSPDGTKVITSSFDKTVKLWDVAAAAPSLVSTFTFSDSPQLEDAQVGCAWIGEHLVSLSLGGELNILDPNNPTKPRSVIRGHSKGCTSLARAGPSAVYSASYDGDVLRWSSGTASRATKRSNSVVALGATLDGGWVLIVGVDDKAVRVPSDAPVEVELGGAPDDVSVSASGDVGAAATTCGIALLRGDAVVSRTELPAGPSVAVQSVAMSPDGGEVAAGGSDGNVYVFKVQGDGLEATATLNKHRQPVTALAYSPDGAMLASADAKRECAVWDTATREVKMSRMVYHTARVTCLGWSPNSRRLASGSLDQNVIVWDTTKSAAKRVTFTRAHLGGVSGVCWLDDTSVASAGSDACLREWACPVED